MGLANSSLNWVAASVNDQNGEAGDVPYESFEYTVPSTDVYHVFIQHYSGAIPSWMQLQAFTGQQLQYATAARSIANPAESASSGMLAVGAVPHYDTNTIEYFSSRGPTTDGRTKPEVVGADRGDSVTYGVGGFSGTSQASPHVAGLAALVVQRFPAYSPAQVADYIKANALPRGSPLPNSTFGYGLAHLSEQLWPGPPTNVTAVAGNGEATVSWTAPTSDGGSAITGYTVTSSPGGLTATAGGSATSTTATGLTNGTAYTFVVVATNRYGDSAPSTASSAVIPSGVAVSVNAPAAVLPGESFVARVDISQVVDFDSGQFDVDFDPAILELSTVTDGSIDGTTIPVIVANELSPGRVRVVLNVPGFPGVSGSGYLSELHFSAIGTDGTLSDIDLLNGLVGDNTANEIPSTWARTTVNVASAPGAPGAPSGVAAVAGNAQADVSWTAPASDGGSAITGYTVTSSPGGLTASVGGGATTATVTGLTNGTGYTFTVTATNAMGTSAPSSPSNAVTPATVPGQPTGVTATAGNAQATVSWTAPTSDGGSAITAYTATSIPGGLTATAGGSATSTTVTGLTNGTAYTFTVTGTNE